MLSPNVYEVVKALDLLVQTEGWGWVNDCVIREHLWPIMQEWSLKSTSGSGSCCDELMVVVVKLIGTVV